MSDKYATAKELSAMFELTVDAIHGLCNRADVKYKRINNRKFFILEDFFSKVKHEKVLNKRGKPYIETDAHTEAYLETRSKNEKLKERKLEIQVEKDEIDLKALKKEVISYSVVKSWIQGIGLYMKDFMETNASIRSRRVAEAMGFDEKLLQTLTVEMEQEADDYLKLLNDHLSKFSVDGLV